MDTDILIITKLKDEFEQWNQFLAKLTEAQVSTPNQYGRMSIKDVLAHLMAWQQISIARLEAGLEDRLPVYPGWPLEFFTSDEDLDKINAWIYDLYQALSWSEVYQLWKDGYLRFLNLAENFPKPALQEKTKYPWLDGYDMEAVLYGSYNHHEEHLVPLLAIYKKSFD